MEYHAATLQLDLWSSGTEAYLVALAARIPGVVVVLHPTSDPAAAVPWVPALITASPYDGQDYMDSGDSLIEMVPMPPGLIAWVRDFVSAHHVEVPFVKRRRDAMRIDLVEDGKGDARIYQFSDVYRAPRPTRQGGGADGWPAQRFLVTAPRRGRSRSRRRGRGRAAGGAEKGWPGGGAGAGRQERRRNSGRTGAERPRRDGGRRRFCRLPARRGADGLQDTAQTRAYYASARF
ncbi:MAG: DUF3305 domain-containing protein [Pseudorhodobacter sp.]|nr:DUF3305 domain-containing protein [Pseudorhodobacter sp.]